MRFSLKLLLLVCALVALLVASWKALDDYSKSMLQAEANSDWEYTYIQEDSGSQSEIAVDAGGNIQSARLAGPKGIAAVLQSDRKSKIMWLSLENRETFESFSLHEFPDLKQLGLGDFDYDGTSLEKLSLLRNLQIFNVRTQSPTTLHILESLPSASRKIMVVIEAPALVLPETCPKLLGISTLLLKLDRWEPSQLTHIRECNPGVDVRVLD